MDEGDLPSKVLDKKEDNNKTTKVGKDSCLKAKISSSIELQCNFRDSNEKFLSNKRRQERSSIFQFDNEQTVNCEPAKIKNQRNFHGEVMSGDFNANKARNSESKLFPTITNEIGDTGAQDFEDECKIEIKITNTKSNDEDYVNSLLQAKKTKLKVLGSSIYM